MSVGPNCEDTVELPCPVGELKVSIRASPTASNGSFDSTSSYPSLLILLVPFLRGCLRPRAQIERSCPRELLRQASRLSGSSVSGSWKAGQ